MADKKRGYGDVLTSMLGNLGLGREARPSWGGETGRAAITTHTPDIRKLTEEEIKEKKMTKKGREIEEAFYREAWRMEVES